MKKLLLLAAGSVLALTASAQAADLGSARTPIGAAVAAPAGFNWTGFYIGGHLGGGMMQGRYFYQLPPLFPLDGSANQSFARSANGVLGGVQIGYNWQMTPNVVFGLEGSVSASGVRKTSVNTGFVNSFSNPDQFRV